MVPSNQATGVLHENKQRVKGLRRNRHAAGASTQLSFRGIEVEFAEHIRQTESAFPFYELIAEDLVAEGDLVALRGTFQGVHGGAFAGIEATGRSVSAKI